MKNTIKKCKESTSTDGDKKDITIKKCKAPKSTDGGDEDIKIKKCKESTSSRIGGDVSSIGGGEMKLLMDELEKERKSNFILNKVNKELKKKLIAIGCKLYGDIFKYYFSKIERDVYIEEFINTNKFRNYKMAENRVEECIISDKHIKNINIINNIPINPINKEKCIKNFKTCIEGINSVTLISNKSIVKFAQLKTRRESSTEYFTINEYKNIVCEQYEVINEYICSKQKILTDKEIETIKVLSFSPLDLLILNKPVFEIISDKDIENSINIFSNSLVYDTCYKSFNVDIFVKYIKDFLELPLDIDLIINRSLNNVYGFNKVVYLSEENINPSIYSNDGDAYNYYILKHISEEIRYWELDCRLENFIDKLYENIINFYTALFRKTYYNLYTHNIYKKENNMSTTTYIGIIFKNINFVSSKMFDSTIKNFVKKNMQIKPSAYDRFNIFSNNIVEQSSCEKEPRVASMYTSDYTSTVKNLFDEISDSDLSFLINLNM